MHVAITGASSGIGEALARHFAGRGDDVTLVARREDRLRQLASELGTRTCVVRSDLAELDTCTAWVDEAEKTLGPIDVLVNNAGIQIVEPALEVSVERSEKLLAINVLAPMRIARRVLPGMVDRGRGAIVTISSMASVTPTPYMADYSASKAAIGHFSEALAGELRGTGVKVVTVYPGPVATPMEKAARDKLVTSPVAQHIPTGTPEELAERITDALDKGRSRVVYPRIYTLGRTFTPAAWWLTSRFTPRPE